MNKIYNIITILCVFFMILQSCKKHEEPVKEASVEIEIMSTTTNSVTFKLVPENAVSISYACSKSSDIANTEFIEMDGTTPHELTIDNLDEKTEYTIMANATNASGITSQNTSETFVTTESASVKIELIETSATYISFRIKTVNAVSFSYAVVLPEDIENAEYTEIAESGPKDITVDNLEANTVYSILAKAKNATGEECEYVIEPAKTEAKPISEIEKITTDGVSATVTINCTDVSNLYCTITDEGATQPEEKDFREYAIKGNTITIYFYELTTGNKYTIWTFGTNKNGFKGDLTSQSFTVEEGVDLGYKAVITNITSFDANVEITWDTSKYPEAYWLVGPVESIPDPDKVYWEEAIENYSAQQLFSPGTYNLSSFMINPGNRYRMGIYFKAAEEGAENAYIWKDIDLKPINIGESDCSIEIKHVMSAHSTITFMVENIQNCDHFLYSYTDSEEKIEETAINAIKHGLKSSDFETEIKQAYLESEKKYYIVAVPVDANGKYGNYAYLEAETGKIEFNGNAKVDCKLKEASYTSLKYNAQFDENAIEASYLVFKDGDYESEEQIKEALAKTWSKLYSSGEINVTYTSSSTNLTSGTEYNIWITATDKYGRLGEIIKLKDATKEIKFDGTGSVSIKIDEIKGQEIGFKIKATLTPDDNVDKFYYKFVHQSSLEGKTDESLAADFFNGFTEPKQGVYQTTGWDGNGEDIYADNYLIILPIDKSGRMCPLIKYFIEDTASN